jgi:hypothetical protein
MNDASTQRKAIEDGFAGWAKRHGFKRKKLTANRTCDSGVQVVALEKSDYSAGFYIRYGIKLDSAGRFVREPECDIRIPVEGPWGRQPAFDAEAGSTEDDVVGVLDAHVVPLLERTRTRTGLEELRSAGGLADALVLRDAQKALGWEDSQ